MKLTGLHIRGDLYYNLLIGLRAHHSVLVKPCVSLAACAKQLSWWLALEPNFNCWVAYAP